MAEQSTVTVAAPVQPIFWLPYAWAEKVLQHMVPMNELSRFPLPIEAVRDATKAIADATDIKLRRVKGRKPIRILGRFTRQHVPVPDVAWHRIEIVIDFEATLEPALQRFVICKELCHCFYSDTPQTRSVSPAQMTALLEGLAALNRTDRSIKPQSPALDAEELAMYTALEILCPFEIRDQIVTHHQNDFSRLNIASLAKEFLLPPNIMRDLFSKGYHDNARISRSYLSVANSNGSTPGATTGRG